MLPLYCLLSYSKGSHGSKATLPFQPFRPQSTWKHPIPRVLSVQMGRANNTCSIKGIRGHLTTLLSSSWPHIDQLVWDHSQTGWQLNRGPAHAQTPSFTHTHTLTDICARTQIHILSLFWSDVDILCIPHRYKHVYLSISNQQTERRKRFLGDWIGFIHFKLSSHEKLLSFFQFPGENCRNQIARIDLKTQSVVKA